MNLYFSSNRHLCRRFWRELFDWLSCVLFVGCVRRRLVVLSKSPAVEGSLLSLCLPFCCLALGLGWTAVNMKSLFGSTSGNNDQTDNQRWNENVCNPALSLLFVWGLFGGLKAYFGDVRHGLVKICLPWLEKIGFPLWPWPFEIDTLPLCQFCQCVMPSWDLGFVLMRHPVQGCPKLVVGYKECALSVARLRMSFNLLLWQ